MAHAPAFGTLDVTQFTVGGMLRAGVAIRQVVRGAETMEAAAEAVVRYLYDHCADPLTGERTCALVRLYKTHPFSGLSPDLRAVAAESLDGVTVSPTLRCLTLMASAGEEEAWNSRHTSRGHRAIPLPSAERVRAAPMIMRLFEDLGIDIESIVDTPERTARAADARTYDVFHVEQALGSQFIPAQREFVIPYRIASVVGFGGVLRSGEVFAVVLFSRAPIPAASAARFRAVALDIRSSLFNFDDASTWNA